MNLGALTIIELHERYAAREVTPLDVVEACLGRIEACDGGINAFLCVFADEARERARELERTPMAGKPLYGIPIAVKDNICTRGQPTTCGSRILEGYLPPYSATAVVRILDAGGVIVGKTNLDEFAMGSSTENSAFGVTRNPWHEAYAPGGSSGGSAAAVAAGMVPIALGSDTGGSIRQPASFCGVTGLKGTYGRVSRYGLVAFASSLDQIGPIAAEVRDCARALQVIGGVDPRDATTIPGGPPDLLSSIEAGLGGLRIAVPAGMAGWELAPPVRESTEEVVAAVREAGAEIVEVAVPDMDAAIACYYVLATAEASSNLARYDGVRYGYRAPAESLVEMYERTREVGFGEEVKRRILLGTYVLSSGYYEAYYAKAQQVKALICNSFAEIFTDIDIMLLPTAPTPAFELGEKTDDPVAMYLSDIFTTTANIAGLPAISVPVGLSPEGLPVGMQLMAAPGGEGLLLRAAQGVEQVIRFRERFERKDAQEAGG